MLNTKGGRSRGPEVIALRQPRRERRNRDAEDFFFSFFFYLFHLIFTPILEAL